MKPQQVAIVILVAAAFLVVRAAVLETLVPEESTPRQQVDLSRAVELVKEGAAARIVVVGDVVEIEETTGSIVVARKEREVSFLETLQGYGATPEQIAAVPIRVSPDRGFLDGAILLGLLLAVLIGAALLAYRPRLGWSLGRLDARSFGRSGAKERGQGASKLTFGDVAGAEEAKQELREVVEFLRAPDRFARLGARVPRGLILIGPPGTGKTLLARATAGEAGVAFFSCSGSEFVEMFVGVGAARIRDLFQRAKKSAPSIIFIDEIDAIGRRRHTGAGNEERDQTLNQVLVEMDGFDQNANVVVMAATNRPDVLDPALLRPGRFDRRILVDGPDVRDRLAILRVHSRGKPLAEDVDLEQVARQTTGFSGADLENVMNEAALLAARRLNSHIGSQDVEEAMDRVLVGLARKSRVISEREKWITAYHEAGHALVAHALPNVDPVQRITIIPRGSSGGHTKLSPMEDRHLWSRTQLSETIAFALGGMAAEELVFGETTTASANDLAESTAIARKMVCLFGMSRELGPIALWNPEAVSCGEGLSEQTASRVDAETRELLEQGRCRALSTLQENRSRLDFLARLLFERETLQGDELSAMLCRRDLPQEMRSEPGCDIPRAAASARSH